MSPKRLAFFEKQGYRAKDIARLERLRRRTNRARNFPTNTCPSSRHLHMIADNLIRSGHDYMVQEEPVHCAESMLAVLASLWEARTKLAKLERQAAGY